VCKENRALEVVEVLDLDKDRKEEVHHKENKVEEQDRKKKVEDKKRKVEDILRVYLMDMVDMALENVGIQGMQKLEQAHHD